jgi:hypothetical protein
MPSNETTIDKLRHLEALYRQGYQNDVTDRSLDKIIELERANARRELDELQERLKRFERQYQISSEEFYRRFRAGEMGDAIEVVEWSIFYDMWESVRSRLEVLEAEST